MRCEQFDTMPMVDNYSISSLICYTKTALKIFVKHCQRALAMCIFHKCVIYQEKKPS